MVLLRWKCHKHVLKLHISSSLASSVHAVPWIAHVGYIEEFWKLKFPFRSSSQAHITVRRSGVVPGAGVSVLHSYTSVHNLDPDGTRSLRGYGFRRIAGKVQVARRAVRYRHGNLVLWQRLSCGECKYGWSVHQGRMAFFLSG